MVRNRIKPDTTRIYLEIPLDYVGKDIEVLLYAVEEVKIDLNRPVHRDLHPGGFNGILTDEDWNRSLEEKHKHRDELGRRID